MFLTLATSVGLKYKMQTIALSSIPILLLICVYLFCPESPIYLVKNDKKQEAESILTSLHGQEKALLILQVIKIA